MAIKKTFIFRCHVICLCCLFLASCLKKAVLSGPEKSQLESKDSPSLQCGSFQDRLKNSYQASKNAGSLCLRSILTKTAVQKLNPATNANSLLTLAPFVVPCHQELQKPALACINEPTLRRIDWLHRPETQGGSRLFFRFTDGSEVSIVQEQSKGLDSHSILRALSCNKLPTAMRIPWPSWNSKVPLDFNLGSVVDDSGKAKRLIAVTDHPSIVALQFKVLRKDNGSNGYFFARDPLAYMRELRILDNCGVPVMPIEVQGAVALAPKLKATVPEQDNSNHTFRNNVESMDQATLKNLEASMRRLGSSIQSKQWSVSENLQFGLTAENDFVVFDPDEPLVKGNARFEGEHLAMTKSFLFYWKLYFHKDFVP